LIRILLLQEHFSFLLQTLHLDWLAQVYLDYLLLYIIFRTTPTSYFIPIRSFIQALASIVPVCLHFSLGNLLAAIKVPLKSSPSWLSSDKTQGVVARLH